jgi:intracellular septation protein
LPATFLQIGYVLARGRKVTNMQWMGLVIIGLFGGATLLLRDETFIKWKPTVLYWLAGIAFSGALAFGRNLVKGVMSEGVELPEPCGRSCASPWGVFFLFKGTLNLYVAYTFPTEFWVNFKLFGGHGPNAPFHLRARRCGSRSTCPEDEAPPAPNPKEEPKA